MNFLEISHRKQKSPQKGEKVEISLENVKFHQKSMKVGQIAKIVGRK